MNLLLFLILVVSVFVILLFLERIKLFFYFDTDRNLLSINVTWIYPFLKAEIKGRSTNPVLIVYLFRRRIFSRKVMRRGGFKPKFPVAFEDARVEIDYGGNPIYTGIAMAAISVISQTINAAKIEQHPVFLADRDYIRINIKAKINGGKTLLNMLEANLKSVKTRRRNNKWTRQPT